MVPYIALVPIAVTADNVADTVVADGFRTLEELCTPEVTDSGSDALRLSSNGTDRRCTSTMCCT